jgi:hypothetical protein
MSTNWHHVKKQVGAYRKHVKGFSPDAQAAAKYSFVITKEEIDRLLAQKEGHTLDGLRIFLGGHEIDGHLVPTIHIIAVEGSDFHDYNVPTSLPEETEAEPMLTAAAATGGGSTGGNYPCPPTCNGSNILTND